jgi:hypothetical protein
MDLFRAARQDEFASASDGRIPGGYIMKFARLILASTLTLAVLPSLAAAQLRGADSIRVKVPFKFVVGNRAVPAGDYVVHSASMDGMMLSIRNGDGNVNLLSMVSPAEAGKGSGTYSLMFHQYGDRYYLFGMRLDDSGTIFKLPESKAERELQAQNLPATETVLTASLQ